MMRKLFITIVLLIVGLGLGADIIIMPPYNFGLISVPEYNLDLRYSALLKRLYVIAEFSVDKKALPQTTYHSFFLSKDVHLEQICIVDYICGSIITEDLVPGHFVPDFPFPALLDSTSNAICHSFNLEPLKSLNTPVKFKLIYWLDMPEPKLDSSGQLSTSINTDRLWFPRNLLEPSALNIRVVTSDQYQIRFGNILDYSDTDGVRTHEGSYADEPNKYFELKFIKKLN